MAAAAAASAPPAAAAARATAPTGTVFETGVRSGNGLVTVTYNGPETCQGQAATIVAVPGQPTTGTDGDDVIVGTQGADVIDAGLGDDLVCSLYGADRVDAGAGADLVNAGPNDDTVNGDAGADELYGHWSADTLSGGEGDDLLFGNPGDDSLDGNGGTNTLNGGYGTDTCVNGPASSDVTREADARVAGLRLKPVGVGDQTRGRGSSTASSSHTLARSTRIAETPSRRRARVGRTLDWRRPRRPSEPRACPN